MSNFDTSDTSPVTAPSAGRGPSTRPTSFAEPATQASADPAKRPPLFGTILWGVLLLGFAAFMVAAKVLALDVDPVVWITGGLIALGTVLVIAGIAAAFRRR